MNLKKKKKFFINTKRYLKSQTCYGLICLSTTKLPTDFESKTRTQHTTPTPFSRGLRNTLQSFPHQSPKPTEGKTPYQTQSIQGTFFWPDFPHCPQMTTCSQHGPHPVPSAQQRSLEVLGHCQFPALSKGALRYSGTVSSQRSAKEP